jgi:hypothetical protein
MYPNQGTVFAGPIKTPTSNSVNIIPLTKPDFYRFFIGMYLASHKQ